jgi:hypothetical protein
MHHLILNEVILQIKHTSNNLVVLKDKSRDIWDIVWVALCDCVEATPTIH